MTLRLITPDVNAPAQTLLDWLELRCIVNAGHVVSFNDLVDARNEEDGYDTSEAEDRKRDDIHSLLGHELYLRSRALGRAYPFEAEDAGLRLSSRMTPGGWSYLLCLRLSLAETGLVMGGTFPDITPQERELFQLCATYAAAGYVCGESISFGWPRGPHHTEKFIPALTRVYHDRIREGTVRPEFLDGQRFHVKDDDIDIIAFRPANDGWPNQFALFGQVASGRNWKDKPLSAGAIHAFHKKWFAESPQLVFIFSLFIPFCPFSDIRQSDRALRRRYMEMGDKYGLLFTRYRIPWCVDRVFFQNGDWFQGLTKTDGAERLAELVAWGKGFVEKGQG